MIYFYRGVSGRIRFVTLEPDNGGVLWTNEKMPVKASSIPDLRPFIELLNKQIIFQEASGIIKQCLPIDKLERQVSNFNNLVRIYWTVGCYPCWININKLT